MFHSVRRNASQQRKAFLAGRLAEILQEQVQPTVSVFIVGRIDAVFNAIFSIIYLVLVLTSMSPQVQIYIIHFLWSPIQVCQFLTHSVSYGIYNKEVQGKLFNYAKACTTRHSKVITLNRQWTKLMDINVLYYSPSLFLYCTSRDMQLHLLQCIKYCNTV